MVRLEPALIGLHRVMHGGVNEGHVEVAAGARPVRRDHDRSRLPLYTHQRYRVPVRHDAGLRRRPPARGHGPEQADEEVRGFHVFSPWFQDSAADVGQSLSGAAIKKSPAIAV